MRIRVTAAALLAAALIGGGRVSYAMTAAANSTWLYAPDAPSVPATDGLISTPDLPFLVASADVLPSSPAGVLDAHFRLAGVSPLDGLTIIGDSRPVVASGVLPDGRIVDPDADAILSDVRMTGWLGSALAVGVGYDSDLGRRFAPGDVRAGAQFAGLFASPSDFNDSGYGESGVEAGATIGLGHRVHVSLAGALSGPDRYALLPDGGGYLQAWRAQAGGARDALNVLGGVDWRFAPWGGIGLTAAHDETRAGLAGGAGSLDGLSLARGAATAVGANGSLALGGGWVTSFSYSQGVTQLDLRPAANLFTGALQRSRSFGVAVAKHGLFGNDALGIAVTRPVLPPNSIDLGSGSATDPFDGFISSNTHPILAGEAAETDMQLGYVTTFMDGALALQANAGYQMNAAGQSGNNGVAVLSRAKINF